MKTVYLIRHAKSDWSNGLLSDFERPLNKRGQRDAPYMAEKMQELNITPDLILSSSATRAVTTARLMAKGVSYPETEIVEKKELYHATSNELLDELCALDKSLNTVFIIAHNPGITMLSNHLTGDFIDNIVTTGIVCIEFDVDRWNEIIQGLGTKVFYIYPKMYLQ